MREAHMFSYLTLYKMKNENQKHNIPIQNKKVVSVQFGYFSTHIICDSFELFIWY